MIMLGAGLGSTMPIFTLAVQSSCGVERLGEVTAGTQLFRSIGGTVGTAVLGGIMNTRLTTQTSLMSEQPFLAQASQLGLAQQGSHFDGRMIQAVLNPESQQQIAGAISKLPAPMKDDIGGNYMQFIAAAKSAFSYSLDGVFLVGGCLMVVALIAVLFLPEIPLRKSNRPAIQEAGIELEDELGHNDPHAQPRVTAVANKRPG
jgi:hypothetical protein